MPLRRVSPLDPHPNYVETFDVTAVTTQTVQGGNSLYVGPVPVRVKPITISKVRVYVSVTGGNFDIGVYQSDGVTLTLLTSTGTTAVGSNTTIQAISLLSSVVLQAGVQYFLGVDCDGATASLGIRTAQPNAVLSAAGPITEFGRKASVVIPLATNGTSVTLSALTAITQEFWIRASAT